MLQFPNFGGGFRWKSEYPWCIIETESGFLYGCNSKTNYCKYLKFLPNVYVSVIYIQLNFRKFFFEVSFKVLRNLSKTRKFASFSSSSYRENSKHHYRKNFNVDKIFLAQSKYLKILYKVPHMHNFFLLAFEVQILTKIRQNHEYLQIILLTNHLRSEPPRSTPPLMYSRAVPICRLFLYDVNLISYEIAYLNGYFSNETKFEYYIYYIIHQQKKVVIFLMK
ncbi:hypothetical protein AGLY_006967 [Aphis glycines]|uniref:Uncharacterized protein n=1 Tax=Aphis glycines TaxID=307491 RepID=A0A6G0TPT9_APHGL|nr:hypothetical protein AGLY_006967 [Aphis glycines]